MRRAAAGPVGGRGAAAGGSGVAVRVRNGVQGEKGGLLLEGWVAGRGRAWVCVHGIVDAWRHICMESWKREYV